MRARILLLEDDTSFRDMLALALRKNGYEVAGAGQGAEAVRLCQEQEFDLVVTDVRMEGMDGLDALSKMKESQPGVGSMVITGYSTEADSVRAIHLGVENYLKKPFRLPDFLEAVERILSQRALREEARRNQLAMRDALLWALGLAVEGLEAQGVAASLTRLEEVVGKLAAAMGLTGPGIAEAQLAALLAALPVAPPQECLERLPERVSVSLEQIREGREALLTARVGAAALACLEAYGPPDPEQRLPLGVLPRILGRRWPGRFEPALLEAVDRLYAGDEPTRSRSGSEEGRRKRSLLSLGRAFEASGQVESARAAYQSALEPSHPCREDAEALLGLARLGGSGGPGWAREAAELAQHLSPANAAPVALEAGLLLKEQGGQWLKASLEGFQAAGDLSGQARARLALFTRGLGELLSSDLERLVQPEETTELGACTFMLPYLLERSAACDELAELALARLARERPTALERLLADPALDPELRRVGLGALQETGMGVELAPQVHAMAPPLLRLYSLGGFEVHRGEHRVHEKEWRSQKVRMMLAYLAYHGGRLVSDEVLLELFWPGDVGRARKNLNPALTHLRGHLRPPGFTGPLNDLVRTPVGIMLNPEVPRWHDVAEFEQSFRASRAAADPIGELRRCAQLYRGPYLEGCYQDWALAIRTRLEEQALEVFQDLASHTLQAGQHRETLDFTQRMLELDACSQEAYGLRMKAFLASGRPQDALRLFEECQRVLEEELDLEPGEELRALRDRAFEPL